MKSTLVLLLAIFSFAAAGTCQCELNPNQFHRDIISNELIQLINFYFPSSGPPHDPTLISNAADPNIHFLSQGNITVTFAFEGASFKNQFGYFVYSIVDGAPVVHHQEIIVPDVSQENCIVKGDSVKIGPFKAGDNVGFYIIPNGQCSPFANIYTLDALNTNNQRQFGVFKDPITDLIVLCIEDVLLPGGDKDFEDVVYVIEVDGNIDEGGIIPVCLPACPIGHKCIKKRDGTTECVPIEEPFKCGDGTTEKKPFGEVASNFNVFVTGDFNCKYSDTEGRLAAGGNVDLEGYSVGCKILAEPGANCINFGDVTCADLAAADEWADTLVGGGKVSWAHGELKTGNLVHGTTKALSNVNIVSDCGARQDSPIDFAAVKAELQQLSDVVKSLSSTGTVVDEYGTLIFQGSNADIEVFSVSAGQLGSANGVKFVGIKDDATVLVNVGGNSVTAGNFGFFGVNPARTLWNFYEATSLTFHSIQWEGSVLALNADIKEPTGQINGQVFGKSWKGSATGTCMQQNLVPFEGCVPTDDGGNIPPPPPPVCVEDCVNELYGAQFYNGFFLEGFFCDVTADVEGRLAAGGDIWMKNGGVANCILLDPTSEGQCVNYQSCVQFGGVNSEALVGGKSIAGNSIGVDAGDVVYGTTISGVHVNGDQCEIRQEAGFINFNAEFAKLRELSDNLNTLAPTGTTTSAFGTTTFTGQGTLDVEVFDLQAATLAAAHTLRLANTKNKATIIINVKGANVAAANLGFPDNTFQRRYTLWNFNEATTLTLKSVGWQGSVLAPYADLKDVNNGNIEGQVIAKSWHGGNGACIELHEEPFLGCVPECF